MAVEVLKSRGVPEDHILFLNLIASPEGVKNFATKFPRLKVVTAFIDEVSAPLLVKHLVASPNSIRVGPGREEVRPLLPLPLHGR